MCKHTPVVIREHSLFEGYNLHYVRLLHYQQLMPLMSFGGCFSFQEVVHH